MTGMFDPKKVAEELKWLKANPQFEEKPASIREFIGPDYLNDDAIRPALVEVLVDIFGEEVNPERLSSYERAMMTGAIGIGKTTFASIAIPYMAHWVLCMKNPQEFFSLMKGTRIAFMQMSTSEKQASEVVFGDLVARIKNCQWFSLNYPHDPNFTKQIRFPQKDIWILPGGSEETSFEGYNILGGILDEMDSHKITDRQDYADTGFDAIENRISSRFPVFTDPDEEEADKTDESQGHRGLLICIGQMKKSTGFASRKFKQFTADPKAYVNRMTIWESLGWDKFTTKDGVRRSFWYDTKRKKIVPDTIIGLVDNPDLLEIPNAYKSNFMNNPEKALKDLAGIPPQVNSPFISQIDKIEACRDRWIAASKFAESPVDPNPNVIKFARWFRGGTPLRHHIHMDFGLSRDAFGLAMGHVDRLVMMDGELKPYIIIDALMRVKALPGQQVQYGDIRRAVYHLKDELKFRIVSVSMDGFDSTDTQQQLRKRHFRVDDLSMDKSMLPYEDLREAIYEERLEFPPYMTYMQNGDTQLVEIAIQELMQLQDTGKKVDHPPEGSKDVADGMAGVVTTLMGDRNYRRGVTSPNMPKSSSGVYDDSEATSMSGLPVGVIGVPSGLGGSGLMTTPAIPSGFELTIPDRLRPGKRRE